MSSCMQFRNVIDRVQIWCMVHNMCTYFRLWVVKTSNLVGFLTNSTNIREVFDLAVGGRNVTNHVHLGLNIKRCTFKCRLLCFILFQLLHAKSKIIVHSFFRVTSRPLCETNRMWWEKEGVGNGAKEGIHHVTKQQPYNKSICKNMKGQVLSTSFYA